MKTFYNKDNNQVKSFNNKISSNLAEYYFLDDLEELGKIKSFNTNKLYINEKYHLKIKYFGPNKKLYSKIYKREDFRDKFIFINIENKLDPQNIKSIKFVMLYSTFRKLNEFSLLKKIARSKYVNQIKLNIEIDFTVKKKYFYLFENPSLYPEEQCNIKYNIFDDEYLINFMESQKNEIQKVKSMNGILPNMKVKINE